MRNSVDFAFGLAIGVRVWKRVVEKWGRSRVLLGGGGVEKYILI